MNNRYDDEFATTLSNLVESPAVTLSPVRVELPVLPPWRAAIAGIALSSVTSIADSAKIKMKFDTAIVRVDDRSYAIGFTYALSPLVEIGAPEIESTPAEQLQVIAPYVDQLRARHGKAFGFVLVKPLSDVSGFTLTLNVTRAPDAAASRSGDIDINLSSFVLYRLLDYQAKVTYPVRPEPGVATLDRIKDLHRLHGPGLHPNPGVAPVTYELAATLRARATDAIERAREAGNPDPEVIFSGSVTLGSSPTLEFEFPDDANTPTCQWSILPYLANLAHYGYPAGQRNHILSYAERLELDAHQPRLAVAADDGPRPKTGRTSRFRWAHRVLHLHSDIRNNLGGAELVRLAPILRLCQDQGVSLVLADSGGFDATQAYAELERYNLLRLCTSFRSLDLLKVSGQGEGMVPDALLAISPPDEARASNLFKNPAQFDIDVLAGAARAFARDHRSLAAVSLPQRGELLVSTPEIGDTWAPVPFLLPTSGADAARRQSMLDELDAMDYELPDAWTPKCGDQRAIRSPTAFRLRPDTKYHHAYWEHLLREYDERIDYWQKDATFAVPGSIPAALVGLAQDVHQNLHDLSGVFSATPFRAELKGSECVLDVSPDYSRFDDVTPGNGPHDLSEYGTPKTPSRLISDRRAVALASTNTQVQWYCQFRHWVSNNIAYLVASSGALKQALNGAPHQTLSNFSKPIGYWGFESYQTVRSGALDAIWFHDDHARDVAGWSHLIFNNVRADFARALTLLPQPEDRPFAARTRPLGIYMSNERVDIKAIVWASRGAKYFEAFFSGDAFSEPNYGWGNTGDLAYQPLAQGRSAMQVLNLTSEFFERTFRVAGRIALLVPQTASIWTLPDSNNGKGFSFQQLLDDDFHGLHSIFTHEQAPVDIVFEESIIDNITAGRPSLPSRCSVLCVGTAYLRDDVFHAIATWVMNGGTLVLGAGLVSPDSNQRVGARFNEFAQDRNETRSSWLSHGNLLSPEGSTPSIRQAGAGCIVDLGSRQWGTDYITALGLKASYPYMVPASSLLAAKAHREQLMVILDVALAATGQLPLRSGRSAWVEASGPAGTTDPALVEVVDLRQVGDNPRIHRPATHGVVVIINHRHRDYQRPAWFDAIADGRDPLDPASAEAPRDPTLIVLHLAGMSRITGVVVAPGPGVSRKLTRDDDGILRIEILLGDYAVIGWKRG